MRLSRIAAGRERARARRRARPSPARQAGGEEEARGHPQRVGDGVHDAVAEVVERDRRLAVAVDDEVGVLEQLPRRPRSRPRARAAARSRCVAAGRARGRRRSRKPWMTWLSEYQSAMCWLFSLLCTTPCQSFDRAAFADPGLAHRPERQRLDDAPARPPRASQRWSRAGRSSGRPSLALAGVTRHRGSPPRRCRWCRRRSRRRSPWRGARSPRRRGPGRRARGRRRARSCRRSRSR